MTMTRASFSSDILNVEGLINGNAHLLIARPVTVTGGNYAIGAVLGKIGSNDKYTLSARAETDGSEVPDAVLAEEVDASAADVVAMAYFRGDFNASALTLGAGHTIATASEAFRGKGIAIV